MEVGFLGLGIMGKAMAAMASRLLFGTGLFLRGLQYIVATLNILRMTFDVAYNGIYAFHAAQKSEERNVENMNGLRCKRAARSIGSVGLYVPGGTVVLPSTALMLSIPAKIAGNTSMPEWQHMQGSSLLYQESWLSLIAKKLVELRPYMRCRGQLLFLREGRPFQLAYDGLKIPIKLW